MSLLINNHGFQIKQLFEKEKEDKEKKQPIQINITICTLMQDGVLHKLPAGYTLIAGMDVESDDEKEEKASPKELADMASRADAIRLGCMPPTGINLVTQEECNEISLEKLFMAMHFSELEDEEMVITEQRQRLPKIATLIESDNVEYDVKYERRYRIENVYGIPMICMD